MKSNIISTENVIEMFKMGAKGLLEAFAEFIRPKSVHERVMEKQKIVDASKERAKCIEIIPKKKQDIAI